MKLIAQRPLPGSLIAALLVAVIPVISEGVPMTPAFTLGSSAYQDNGSIPARFKIGRAHV